MQLYSSNLNKQYKLKDTPFAKGGEGGVFDVIGNTNLVAKIYNDPKKITNELKKKLERMSAIKANCSNQTIFDNYAWPEDVLYKNKKFVGYIMPRIKNTIKLKEFYPYSDKQNNSVLDNTNWKNRLDIAINLCITVHNIHYLKQVIGDLNPDNVLVQNDNGTIRVILVDTDSYHITVNDNSTDYFRCNVAKPLFVAPELQGKDLRNIPVSQSFTEYTDRFSLAILIFLTLMNGVHPFSCSGSNVSSSQIQPADFIKKGITPFFEESNKLNLEIKIYAEELSKVFPETTEELFKRAFVLGIKQASLRPSAREWYTELINLEKNLRQCSKKKQHYYYNKLSRCPWCKINNKVNGNNGGTQIDDEAIKDDILGIISKHFQRNVNENTNFYTELSASDKDINNIILQVEKQYNIKFDDNAKKEIKNVNGINTLINYTISIIINKNNTSTRKVKQQSKSYTSKSTTVKNTATKKTKQKNTKSTSAQSASSTSSSGQNKDDNIWLWVAGIIGGIIVGAIIVGLIISFWPIILIILIIVALGSSNTK